MKPLVSVIVPVYNAACYLPQCLESLVQQTLAEIEIILVNDASTDESLTILRECANRYPSKVVVIDSLLNLRQGGARNLGLKTAKADFVGFVDSDDWVDTAMFQKMYTKAVSTRADLVRCFVAVDDEISSTSTLRDICESALSVEGRVLTDNDREVLFAPGGGVGGIWSELYSKDMLLSNDLWFPEHITNDDMYFQKIVPFYVDRCSFVQEHLYHYRIHSESISGTRNAPWFSDKLKIQCMALDDIAERGLSGRCSEPLEFAFLNSWWNATRWWEERCDGDLPVDGLKEMRKQVRERFPRFRRNAYYDKYFSYRARLLISAVMLSPTLYLHANRVFRLKDHLKRGFVERLRKHPSLLSGARNIRRSLHKSR